MANAQHIPTVAVILPCFNEASSIGDVVTAFRAALPAADIYVYDNASTDGTARVARAAGAIVRHEPQKGKGNAVRRAFADVDADIYVMADGDDTYDAADAPAMIELLRQNTFDMIVGVRETGAADAYRPGHVFGNRAFSAMFRWLFRSVFTDILSGYRVFSRRFVKSFPSASAGFEIELEISTHAALLRLPVAEMATQYRARPEGGVSKLNTMTDGYRILRRMFSFLRLHRPRFVYSLAAAAGALLSVAFAAPVIVEYLETGLVPRFPTLIVAASMMLAAFVVFAVGIILDSQARYFAETKRLAYVSMAPPAPIAESDPA
ncbi:MAG: glycosyltransferase family 2 protein [Pseudomonadota bacterium]